MIVPNLDQMVGKTVKAIVLETNEGTTMGVMFYCTDGTIYMIEEGNPINDGFLKLKIIEGGVNHG